MAEKPIALIFGVTGQDGTYMAELLLEKGYEVLVMDYRTYGKSRGQLSEPALYNDAQLCYNYVNERSAADQITIYGRSLGSGIASYIAANNEARQLVLETPYYSMRSMANHSVPYLPISLQ